MREVKISKGDLQRRIQTNRDSHRDIYEKAIDGYTKAAVRFFENELAKAKAGEQFVTYFSEPMPEDHTDDYDNVLEMLKMSVDHQITLSHSEFKQYVRDDWGWKQNFNLVSQSYIGN